MNIQESQPKSNSLEDLQQYIADCSSVVRDKDPKSPAKLWERLKKESIGDKASRVFEYLPCKISADYAWDLEQSQYFGFFADMFYYTNARELLNWGDTIEDILGVVDFTNYRTYKCETPYFIYGQVSTHNQITSVSHSQRYAECDRGYWWPQEFIKYHEATLEGWNELVNHLSPPQLKNFMKNTLGIKRKEVWDRGSDMLQNRVFTLGGYINNPNAWPHFIKQRTDLHTQLETQEFVQMIKKTQEK